MVYPNGQQKAVFDFNLTQKVLAFKVIDSQLTHTYFKSDNDILHLRDAILPQVEGVQSLDFL